MKSTPMLITACFLLSCAGASIQPKEANQSSRAFLEKALERIEDSIEEEERSESQELVQLERSERWAQYQFEDKAYARREATSLLRKQEANAQRDQSGASARAYEAAERAARAATIEESKAKANLEEKRRERILFEQTARTNAERRFAQMAQLSRLKHDFQSRPTQALLEEIEESTFQLARERAIHSQVYWKTSPKPGAILNYQTKRQRERGDAPLTVGCETNCPEKIPIGKYFIWATRKGNPTSNVNRLIMIVEPIKTIDIVEDH